MTMTITTPAPPFPPLASNVAPVRAAIAAAALRSGRVADSVTLVAVTKGQPADAIRAVALTGVHDVGENRVQEADEKVAELAGNLALTWHLIGPLQTNKINRALTLFRYVHSVESVATAAAISKRLGAGRRLAVLLEVNVAADPQKHGFAVGAVPEAAARIIALPGLDVEGLMTIAPAATDPEASRPWFGRLRELRDRLRRDVPAADWQYLSMGMSHDFTVAIEEGATMVRIGTAIFGPRR